MPLYDFRCAKCGRTDMDVYAEVDERTQACKCGKIMHRLFPLKAALGAQGDFEPYYDEVLDCDIQGRKHKRWVLRELGLIEAGDAQRGARSYDEKLPRECRLE